MSRTKQAPATTCGGYNRDGIWVPCQSPTLPVGRDGRCTRCDRLHRADALRRSDPFPSVNDVVLPGEVEHAAPPVRAMVTTPALEPESVIVTDEPVTTAIAVVEPEASEPTAKPWCAEWSSCLLCGSTSSRHQGNGLCTPCGVRSSAWRRKGKGLTLVWLPFSRFYVGAYDQREAKRWVTVRDLDEAARYLDRRASAGGIPAGGKVVIRRTDRADQLPEVVIRLAAA
jgi:hypothetical protein